MWNKKNTIAVFLLLLFAFAFAFSATYEAAMAGPGPEPPAPCSCRYYCVPNQQWQWGDMAPGECLISPRCQQCAAQ